MKPFKKWLKRGPRAPAAPAPTAPRLMISPNFGPEKLRPDSTENRIDVFEDRMNGWMIGWAEGIVEAQPFHGGFAALAILLPYFEASRNYREGADSRDGSKKAFIAGVLDVFPPTTWEFVGMAATEEMIKAAATRLYESARCGLAHDAMVRQGIFVSPQKPWVRVMPRPADGQISTIAIGPPTLVAGIRAHFDAYMARLRNPVEGVLRDNFNKMWDKLHPPDFLWFPPA